MGGAACPAGLKRLGRSDGSVGRFRARALGHDPAACAAGHSGAWFREAAGAGRRAPRAPREPAASPAPAAPPWWRSAGRSLRTWIERPAPRSRAARGRRSSGIGHSRIMSATTRMPRSPARKALRVAGPPETIDVDQDDRDRGFRRSGRLFLSAARSGASCRTSGPPLRLLLAFITDGDVRNLVKLVRLRLSGAANTGPCSGFFNVRRIMFGLRRFTIQRQNAFLLENPVVPHGRTRGSS